MEIRQTAHYRRWFDRLRDRRARARIDIRLRRLSIGHFGDVKSLGGGLSELRIDYGPGYRVYLAQLGASVVLLLIGGDKSRQQDDIAAARDLLAQLEE